MEPLSQLPLNATSMHLMNHSMIEIDDSSLADFLRDIMMPIPPISLAEPGPHSMDFLQQHNYYSGRDVFNFGMECMSGFQRSRFWMNQLAEYTTTRMELWHHPRA